MALIRWEPVRELQTIQNEMNRLFGSFFDVPAGASPAGATSPRRWIPAMDLVETEDDFVLRADLPGLSEGDVNIEFEDNVLTVSGTRKAEHEDDKEGYYRVERSWGSFSRSLTLPEGVNAEAIRAGFDNGVLEVRIPKPEARRPRKVAISVGAQAQAIDSTESSGNGGEATPAADAATTGVSSAEAAGVSS
jgi:HSP20 family protein